MQHRCQYLNYLGGGAIFETDGGEIDSPYAKFHIQHGFIMRILL